MATPQRKVPAVVVLFLFSGGLLGSPCVTAGLLTPVQEALAQTPSAPSRGASQDSSEDLDNFVADKAQMDPAVTPTPKPRLLKQLPPPTATPGVSPSPQPQASTLPPTVTIARSTTRTVIHIPTGVIAGVLAAVSLGVIALILAKGRRT